MNTCHTSPHIITPMPSFLATPEFATLSFHTLTAIHLPIHVFATYCILFRTPASMQSVKWTMFHAHFWNMILDLGISMFLMPVILYPVLAGYTLGVLHHWGVPMLAQTYGVSVVMALVGTSSMALFENRFYLLFAKKSWWHHARSPFLIANYLLTFIFFIPACLYIPDQAYARSVVFKVKMLPELPNSVCEADIFVFVLDNTSSIILPFALMSGLTYSQALVFVGLTFYNMEKLMRTRKMSRQTVKMQRRMLKVICVQVTAPMTIILIPFAYTIFIFSVAYTHYNQALNNITFLFFATYGLTSTIVMISLHRPYRKVCRQVFCSGLVGNGGSEGATNTVSVVL